MNVVGRAALPCSSGSSTWCFGQRSLLVMKALSFRTSDGT